MEVLTTISEIGTSPAEPSGIKKQAVNGKSQFFNKKVDNA
jgi:hypothetical protein